MVGEALQTTHSVNVCSFSNCFCCLITKGSKVRKPNGAACNLSLTTHEQLQEIPDAPFSIKTPVSCLPNRPLLLQTSDSVSTHTFLCLHTGLHIKHCTTIVVLIMSSIQPSNSGKRLVKIQDHKHKMQNKSDSAKAICMRLQEIQRSHWVPEAS